MNDRVYVMRQSIVKLTQMLAGRGIQVTQQGISAYVRADASGRPAVVNLPYMPDNATEELIDAIQGFLDHEVAHILFTDFTLMAEAQKHDAGSMLNLLEDTRIERCMSERFQGASYNLANTGRFFLEKYTVPKMNEAMATGNNDLLLGVLTVPLLRAMSGQTVFKEFMKDKMGQVAPIYDKIKDLTGRIEKLESTQACLDLAKVIVKRLRDGDEDEKGGSGAGKSAASKPSSGSSGSVPPGAKKTTGVAPKKKAPAGKSAKAPEEEKDEEKEDPTPAEEEGAPAPAESEKPGAPEKDEDKGPGASGEKDEEGEGDSEEEDSEPGGATAGEGKGDGSDDMGEADEGEEGEVEDFVPPKADPAAKKSEAGEIDTSRMSAASWDAIDKETANDFDSSVSNAITNSAASIAADSDYLVFSTDGDVIEPMRVGSGYADRMLVDLMERVDHMVSPLQKDLERAISARSLSVYSAGHRSGRLHSANLSRLATGDDRVFRRRHDATSKDVAVMLVVDASGSMNGSKIHTATQAAYALASTLERIGIKSEVLCFTTGAVKADRSLLETETKKIGRSYSRIETLYMPILKGFDERLSSEVKKRFAWLPHSSIMASNVDGECVEIAARRLLGRRETGKVMLVLSDGAPAASGGSRSLEAHLKRTVQSISKAGINVIGIGIESEAVQKFYPKHLVLRNVTELPGAVMKELRSLIVKN